MSGSAPEIVPWRENLEPSIADFVAAHPEGLIYYGPAFRRYLMSMLGARCRSLVALEGGAVTGVLPLMEQDGPYGRVLNTLPFFGSNGGVLARTAQGEAGLRQAYERTAAEPDVAASTWISHPFVDVEPPSHALGDERIAQWTDLDPTDAMWEQIDSSARRNARKAAAAGVTVREAPEALVFLEALHRENMTAIGGRQKPEAFFSALPAAMSHGVDWRLYVAEREGEQLAALLTFEAARTVEYVMPAVKETARTLQPTAAILVHAMTDAAARGMRRWNWGGTWLTQEGVYRFKRKWGAKERRYRYFTTVNNRKLLDTTAAELSKAYGYFYTVPFHLLSEGAVA